MDTHSQAAELNAHIAATLRTLREERRWSLTRTAQVTGVSKAMLGQIERGESNPTMATLWKIASGFEVSFSRFWPMTEEKPESSIRYPAVRATTFSDPDTMMNVAPLLPFDPQTRFELLVVELQPGCCRLATSHAKGVIEHVIVIKGVLEVLIDGSWQRFKRGEAVRFAADREHGYRNRSTASATFHNVIYYPR
ncbi:helix-turn-helix domain-containing protein [Phytohalomonas tamaricis]|uniref:helix-turn-helix domain-containing protein n=1 Tax=Phytohalomonas tamaricis TaxID=2081032 RepID=UPI000D0BDED0|nr:XRE family transcriptional regulator [Phytohalomonas tamaricis]